MATSLAGPVGDAYRRGAAAAGDAPRPLSIVEASAGMLVQDLVVRASDVVFVKGIVEASEGIAVVFAERGGELTLAAPEERRDEFAELLLDLKREVGAAPRLPGGPR
jgi:hypothetical protein